MPETSQAVPASGRSAAQPPESGRSSRRGNRAVPLLEPGGRFVPASAEGVPASAAASSRDRSPDPFVAVATTTRRPPRSPRTSQFRDRATALQTSNDGPGSAGDDPGVGSGFGTPEPNRITARSPTKSTRGSSTTNPTAPIAPSAMPKVPSHPGSPRAERSRPPRTAAHTSTAQASSPTRIRRSAVASIRSSDSATRQTRPSASNSVAERLHPARVSAAVRSGAVRGDGPGSRPNATGAPSGGSGTTSNLRGERIGPDSMGLSR